MKNLLLSTTNFVEEIKDYVHESHDFERGFELMFGYVEFKKQNIQKWMFVPCKLVDGVWVVLEKPLMFYTKENIKHLKGIEVEIANSANNRVREYEEAKERILFDGFTYHKGFDRNNPDFWFVRNSSVKIHDYEFEVSSITIDDLSNISQSILLSYTALKQIDYAEM